MKIDIYIKRTHLHAASGGLETQNKQLAEGLVRAGHKITVVSPLYELKKRQIDENGVIYRFLDCRYTRTDWMKEILRGRVKPTWDKAAVKYFKENSGDLIISQSTAGYPIMTQENVPVITIAHGTILSEFRTFLKRLNLPRDTLSLIKNLQFVLREYLIKQRKVIRMSSRVVAVSEVVKDAVVSETGISPEKVDVIYNGVDITKFSRQVRKDTRDIKLLYVGALIREKGPGDLLKAFKKIRDKYPTASLSIVGDGEDKEYFINLAKEYGLGGVNFVGYVEYSRIPKILEDHNIFVFPTKRDEGFPMVVIEAVCAGLPVIATDKGGIKNAVKDNVNGVLLEPGQDLAEAIYNAVKFIRENKRVAEMSKESIKLSEKFSLKETVRAYEKVIKTLR